MHHSAEVMTTLTELRQHPVEIIAFMNWIGLATGIVFGVMTYAFVPGVRPFTLLNGNILIMTFLLTYGHLRHSHMWIAFTGIAGRILQSPAHHQLHHSTNPIHFDKNLGFALAVWDWAFGTLTIPAKTREPIVFGVGDEGAAFRSTLSALTAPFARSAGHALRLVQRVAGERPAPPTPLKRRRSDCGFPSLPNLPILRLDPIDQETLPCRAKNPRAGAACCWCSSPQCCGAWRACLPTSWPISTCGR